METQDRKLLRKIERAIYTEWRRMVKETGCDHVDIIYPRRRYPYLRDEQLKRMLAPLVAKAIKTPADIKTAVVLILSQRPIKISPSTVGDTQSIDYGEPITAGRFNITWGLTLAKNSRKLRRLLDKRLTATSQC